MIKKIIRISFYFFTLILHLSCSNVKVIEKNNTKDILEVCDFDNSNFTYSTFNKIPEKVLKGLNKIGYSISPDEESINYSSIYVKDFCNYLFLSYMYDEKNSFGVICTQNGRFSIFSLIVFIEKNNDEYHIFTLEIDECKQLDFINIQSKLEQEKRLYHIK